MANEFVDVYDQGTPAAPENQGGGVNEFVDVYDSGHRDAVDQSPQKESQMTLPNVLRQVLGQGTAMGFGDEIEGLVRGVYEAASNGSDYGTAINAGIDYVRKQNREFESANPKSALAMQMGGGLATGVAGAGRALAAKGLSLGAKTALSAKTSAAMGGVAGAGMSEGGIPDRALGAAIGAGTGLVAGAALPVLGAGLKKAGSAITRHFPGGSTRQSEGLFRNAMGEAGVTPQSLADDLSTLGPQGVAADVGDRNVRDLARYTANKMGGKGAIDMLRKRHVDQGPRIETAINKNIKDQSLDDYLFQTAKTRRAQANKDYGSIRDADIELTPELKTFFKNKEIKNAYRQAKKIADASDEALTPLSTATESGFVYAKPNMRTLDYIKQSLDDKVSKAYKSGDNNYANAMKNLRDDFRDHIDEILPEYKIVRSAYAGHSAAMEAAETGSQFIMSNKNINQNVLKNMGEHEKEAFLVGVSDALKFKVLSPQDGADVTKKIFGSHLNRRRLEAAFGDDKAAYKKFEQVIKNEIKMAETNSAVAEGSRTAPMMMDENSFNKAADVMGDVLGAKVGSPTSIGSLATRLFDKLQTPPEAVARKLESLLLSQDPKDQARAIEVLSKGGETSTNKLSRLLRAPAASAAGYTSGRTQGK